MYGGTILSGALVTREWNSADGSATVFYDRAYTRAGELRPYVAGRGIGLVDSGPREPVCIVSIDHEAVEYLQKEVKELRGLVDALVDGIEKMDANLCDYKASMDYYKGLYEATLAFEKHKGENQ
jgi:hypothetical protein